MADKKANKKGRAIRQDEKLRALKKRGVAGLSEAEAAKLATKVDSDAIDDLKNFKKTHPDLNPLKGVEELGFGERYEGKLEKVSEVANKKLKPLREQRLAKVAAGRAVQGSAAGRLGAIGKKMLGSPVKLGIAGAALGVANMVGPDLFRGAKESLGFNEDKKTRQLREMLEAREAIERFGRIQKRRQRDLETMVNVNTEMLARNAPHLFNQIMAGRELPQDATVIGGEPRTDLMREVATQMSQGAFSQGEANGPSFP